MSSPARRQSAPDTSPRLRLVKDPVSEAVARFGAAVAEKSGRGGDSEEQLRGPTEDLLRFMGGRAGLRTIPYGEVRLKDIKARPDFAVDAGGVRVGYVELKAPGRGTPATWRRPDKREKDQWAKLQALPNVLYTDGLDWACFRYGELVTVVKAEGDIFDKRRPISIDSAAFERLIHGFLAWEPEQPRTLAQLIGTVAGLCRLLRDEVAAILADPSRDVVHEELTLLADDWRELLFPDLDDAGFADAYAQTVTFALLLARIDGISFDGTPLHEIARLLGKKHSLMGRALSVLTDNDASDELRMIGTMRRVIGCVDWSLLDDGRTDIHADLYERFLSTYDPALRKRSGSYYTPQGVAGAVVDLVNAILCDRFRRPWGLADDDVIVVDPAMGTGTFLVEVLRSAATTIEVKQGEGARGPRLRKFFEQRLVGFEIQAAPYAVAELRVHQAMKTRFKAELPVSERRFLTDALYGLPWCFWRWALWKAFEAHPKEPQGIVAFVTPASFLRGRSFQGMREYLRRTCDEGWIIELSPEGNRPQQNTRLFGPDVGRQLCVAIFARYGSGDRQAPATVHRVALTGTAPAKLERLRSLTLDDPAWIACRTGWRQPFLPTPNEQWERYPSLKDLFPESSRGVTTGRTWVYAPDTDTLRRRWRRFLRSSARTRRELLPESRDRTARTTVRPLPGFPESRHTLADEDNEAIAPIRVGFRAFDRQWLIPDSRLIVMPRPPLWAVRSNRQIYLAEQNSNPIDSGPAVTFSALIPDLHYYNGRSGQIIPLYCDADASSANVAPRLLEHLTRQLRSKVTGEDLFAYVAGVAAHPAFTARFVESLKTPGLRVPITKDADLWRRTTAIGREVLWLHTLGEAVIGDKVREEFQEFVIERGPRVLSEISDEVDALPQSIAYDEQTATLVVGDGRIGPVRREVWEYDVGGMRIIRHWFNYRCANRRYGRHSSRLDTEEPLRRWSPEMTDELLEMLAALEACVGLAPEQAEILDAICRSSCVSVDELTAAGIIPVGHHTRLAATVERPRTLF